MGCRICRTALALLLLAGGAAQCEEQRVEATQTAGVALPASLPLRRDTAQAPVAAVWWPSLALVTLAGAGGAWTLWRRKARRGASSARALEDRHAVRVSSQALTAQASVHVVRWNGEELLVGCTAQQLQLLARRPMPDLPKEEQP